MERSKHLRNIQIRQGYVWFDWNDRDQLVELGTNSDKLKSLVKWIFIKCNSDKDLLVQKYIREAMQHYVKDRSSIQLIGVLVRDTNPNEMDLKIDI